MNLQQRIDLLKRLGEYILSGETEWQQAKEKASLENSWFTPEFIDTAANHIADCWLKRSNLDSLAEKYKLPVMNLQPKSAGIVMAGNIPLVGFHDFLSVFLTGHHLRIKLSSKDNVLLKHLVAKMEVWNKDFSGQVQFEDMLKGCNAYIATGSNNSSRYFEYYFKKYPHIIRRNRTSVALLEGTETAAEMEQLADDVHLFFGLGCRNVTKIFVPAGYDFIPLLAAFKKYNYLCEYHKYKNNYDYNLAIHILNNKFYMSTDALLLLENTALFSPISQLNYEFYTNKKEVTEKLRKHEDVQSIVGKGYISFGKAQYPLLTDFADGVDTIEFLASL